MATRQEQRSEETKNSILTAARQLFANRGYDTVTMREIAKEAGCSHTTIYIYFKDKETLLQQLSMPPLQALMERMDALSEQKTASEEKLEAVSLAFIEFCLANRSMYSLFVNVKAGRVDEQSPQLEINKIRNDIFAKLSRMVQASLLLAVTDEQLLMCTRIYFYTLHGIVATYEHSEETVEMLMDRLTPTFRQAISVLLSGFRETCKET
ncbi:TetR/AcrR family transcriptional regulator [Brevibacillus fluminis]|uniref:TetR/AcrR family transcriptional regulator n=1 Tax=Brevibacillus fluminis TaxID=511487 RepID=A0A3M8DG68_9BACL|nr:TetR/AcrR family transcriptional regulator [Brevibacillus fluminis]RNB87120.1 TetR/AcrR family transcriptional regulator [Brevibacillus fluminis]